MKYLAAVLTITVTAFGRDFKQVGKAHINWNGHGAAFVFLSDAGGSDGFNRLTIRIDGGARHAFASPKLSSWTTYALKDRLTAALRRRSLVQSPFLLQLSISAHESLIFAGGPGVGSSPGPLLVLRLIDKTPVALLQKNELELHDVVDLDSDGVSEIVAMPCYSQTIGDDVWTYDPRYVFRVTDKQAVFSEPLSKAYNEAHYAGWIGPQCSEKWMVLPKRLARGGTRTRRAWKTSPPSR